MPAVIYNVARHRTVIKPKQVDHARHRCRRVYLVAPYFAADQIRVLLHSRPEPGNSLCVRAAEDHNVVVNLDMRTDAADVVFIDGNRVEI